jgi:hypothetical protein
MLLATAVIPRTDLARLVESITPFRVTIDEERGRVITLGRPRLELVSGEGIRLRGSGLVSWDFAHVSIPVRVNAWQLLFVPRVASRGGSHVLSLVPLLEELEVKSVPGLVDGKIAGAIRRAITQNQNRLASNFARTLSRRLPLPARVSPTSTFSIFPVGGNVTVNEREVQLVLQFEAQFSPEPEPEFEVEAERTVVAETEGETESAREQAHEPCISRRARRWASTVGGYRANVTHRSGAELSDDPRRRAPAVSSDRSLSSDRNRVAVRNWESCVVSAGA